MAKLQNKDQTTKIIPEIAISTPSLFDIPDNILVGDKRLFYPTWDNRPLPTIPIITIDDKRVLSQGGYLAFISKPGAGKSSICEAIVASAVCPSCDSLGITVSLTSIRNKCLYIDTERTPQDTWLSWQRTMQRAAITNPEINKRIIFVNFKAIPVTERIAYTEKILTDNPEIGLVLFDGAADFVIDVNSMYDTIKFTDWINSFNPLISQVFTVHTNPSDQKPRGHIGSEILRRAESVFLLEKILDNPDDNVRMLTSNFTNGKVRNDSDNITIYYKWADNHSMFISTEYKAPPPRTIEHEKELNTLAAEMFDGKTQLNYAAMIGFIKSKKTVGDERCKKIIQELRAGSQIVKIDTNVWEKVQK